MIESVTSGGEFITSDERKRPRSNYRGHAGKKSFIDELLRARQTRCGSRSAVVGSLSLFQLWRSPGRSETRFGHHRHRQNEARPIGLTICPSRLAWFRPGIGGLTSGNASRSTVCPRGPLPARAGPWKYRGIFLNDEAARRLRAGSEKSFGNYNHQFYEKVFELLLRLKANYLWPAMWNNAFQR